MSGASSVGQLSQYGLPPGATAFTQARIVANADSIFSQGGVPGKRIYVTAIKIFGCGATVGEGVTPEIYDYGGAAEGMYYAFSYAFATGPQVANTPLILDFSPPIYGGVGSTVEIHVPASGAGGLRNVALFAGYIL